MSIITISRGSYTKGKEIAEKLAGKLGYECIAREAIIEASKEFNIPEAKLVRALHDAPSILDKITYGKEKFIAYYQIAFLEHLQKDNIVYHGLAGHFLLKDVAHVLKVRIIADMAERIKLEMAREKISEREAARLLRNDDEERRKWSQHVYGIDTSDSSLYDLVIHINKITVEEAVDIIFNTVRLDHFKTTPESQRIFGEMLLGARVKLAIIDYAPDAEVYYKKGVVFVKTSASPYKEEILVNNIRQAAQSVAGVEEVNVYVMPILPFGD
ncbi:MAG TPA: cytidylate kinase-like family protein [Dissulfurispiraceae bacterium]|nr:cytidylate kinase-like family protein [Dissulfurispiraceae bacterium]